MFASQEKCKQTESLSEKQEKIARTYKYKASPHKFDHPLDGPDVCRAGARSMAPWTVRTSVEPSCALRMDGTNPSLITRSSQVILPPLSSLSNKASSTTSKKKKNEEKVVVAMTVLNFLVQSFEVVQQGRWRRRNMRYKSEMKLLNGGVNEAPKSSSVEYVHDHCRCCAKCMNVSTLKQFLQIPEFAEVYTQMVTLLV